MRESLGAVYICGSRQPFARYQRNGGAPSPASRAPGAWPPGGADAGAGGLSQTRPAGRPAGSGSRPDRVQAVAAGLETSVTGSHVARHPGGHAFGQHRGSHRGHDLGPRLCVECLSLHLGRVRQRQEDVAARQDQVLQPRRRSAFSAPGRRAPSATLSPRSCATTTAASAPMIYERVRLNELLVPGGGCPAPPLRLRPKPVAREIQRARPGLPAQLVGDLRPVDAASSASRR